MYYAGAIRPPRSAVHKDIGEPPPPRGWRRAVDDDPPPPPLPPPPHPVGAAAAAFYESESEEEDADLSRAQVAARTARAAAAARAAARRGPPPVAVVAAARAAAAVRAARAAAAAAAVLQVGAPPTMPALRRRGAAVAPVAAPAPPLMAVAAAQPAPAPAPALALAASPGQTAPSSVLLRVAFAQAEEVFVTPAGTAVRGRLTIKALRTAAAAGDAALALTLRCATALARVAPAAAPVADTPTPLGLEAGGRALGAGEALVLGCVLSAAAGAAGSAPATVAELEYTVDSSHAPPLVAATASCRYAFVAAAESGTQVHRYTDVLARVALHPSVPRALVGVQVLVKLPPPLSLDALPADVRAAAALQPAAPPAYGATATFLPPTAAFSPPRAAIVWKLAAANGGEDGDAAAAAAAGSLFEPGRSVELKGRVTVLGGAVLAAHARSPVVSLPVQLLFSLPADACVPVAVVAATAAEAVALRLPPQLPLAAVASLVRGKTTSACRANFAAADG